MIVLLSRTAAILFILSHFSCSFIFYILCFSPEKSTSNGEFKHFNIYRSTLYFNNVAGMTPYVSGERDQSLQNPGKIKYKDLYPPINRELYYAVTVVDGEGQEEKNVQAKKVFKNMKDRYQDWS